MMMVNERDLQGDIVDPPAAAIYHESGEIYMRIELHPRGLISSSMNRANDTCTPAGGEKV
jgi:hypothetical protein